MSSIYCVEKVLSVGRGKLGKVHVVGIHQERGDPEGQFKGYTKIVRGISVLRQNWNRLSYKH